MEPALIGVWIALVGLAAVSSYLGYVLPTGVYDGRIRARFTALVVAASVDDAAILDFYDDPTMRPGWELAERGALLRVLRRDTTEMTVVVGSAGHIIYALGSSRQTGR